MSTDRAILVRHYASDESAQLQALMALLLVNQIVNAVSPVSPEGTAVQNTPLATENDNAIEQYPRHITGST